MPVFNGERYLKAAIDSILNQTFQDLELIIIDDGSTDSTEQIISAYNDPRIKYYKNPENIGIVASLNKGIDLCTGEFIARMDADDISLPERLQKQWDFLNANPEFAMVGGNIEEITDDDQHIRWVNRPCPAHLLKTQLFFRNTFVHPIVLIRKNVLEEFRYNANYIYAEDYFLWSQIAFKYPVTNLPETLMKYRKHQQSVSVQHKQQQVDTVKKIHAYHFQKLSIVPTSYESNLHYNLLCDPAGILIFSKKERKNVTAWVNRVLKQNESLKVYDEDYFATKLKYRWSWKKKAHIVLLKIRNTFKK
ncbi:MAG: glycosyltransferase [Bacteroidales bacterium]|nr:glycosyltransferase [Bacteroidales bacterium]